MLLFLIFIITAKINLPNVYLNIMLPIQNQTSSISEIGIYSAFETIYKNLGGENTVGKPITTLQYNFQEDRIEQYYENIAFYQLFNDQTKIGLLSYGVFACENERGAKLRNSGWAHHLSLEIFYLLI